MIDIKTQKQFLDLMLEELKYTEDKSPNSFSYDNLSAVGVLAEDLNTDIHLVSEMFDVENLESEYLEKTVFQRTGIKRNQATFAAGQVLVKGEVGTLIPETTIFMAGDIKYSIDKSYIIPNEGAVVVNIKALESGEYGNISEGMINRTERNILGVTSISNPILIKNGYNTETDDELRKRYYYKLQNPPKAGNPSHYKLWAEEVDGIGEAKVFRTWNGPSTVKVVIIGADRTGVDEDMIQKVHDHIMQEAPIHWENLTVESASELPIDISVDLDIQNGYTLEQVKSNVIENIEDYLFNVSFKQSYVSYAKLACAIMSAEGVKDHNDLTINGVVDNIDLSDVQVGVMGSLEVI